MEYSVLFIPYVLGCLAVGFGFGILSLLLGSAPFVVLVFSGSESSIPFSLSLLGAAGALCFFSQLKSHIDWKEVFRLGLFFFLGVGIAFYFSFRFYFRFPFSFLFISTLAWLISLPFFPKTIPHRQFTFYPFFSNLIQGLLAGIVVGALGFAGFPLIVPFLQIFRKMDRQGAVSTSLPLGIVALSAFVLVLYTPAVASGPLFNDPSLNETYYLLVAGIFFVGMLVGANVGKGVLKSISPLVVSFVQIVVISVMFFAGWKQGKTTLPCFSRNPFTCLSCFRRDSQKLDWSSASLAGNSKVNIVIDSCGEPLGLLYQESKRSDFVVQLPSTDLTLGLNKETGLYSESWEGVRLKKVRKHRLYFDKSGCLGKAALSKRKLETQVGVSAVVDELLYRNVTAARGAFWYASYRDASGECINQSGVIKSSEDFGVYDLSLPFQEPAWGEASLDEECCHKFLAKDKFTSTLYYSDEECQSASVATDDEGPSGIGKSVLFHQDKYYLIKSKKASFEYHSYRHSGKDCVKQSGLLAPSSERQAFAIEDIPRPFDFSQHLPLSVRSIRMRDLRFWGNKQ